MANSSKMTATELQILILADELVHMLHAQELTQALDVTNALQTHLAHIEQELYAVLTKDA